MSAALLLHLPIVKREAPPPGRPPSQAPDVPVSIYRFCWGQCCIVWPPWPPAKDPDSHEEVVLGLIFSFLPRVSFFSPRRCGRDYLRVFIDVL